MLVESRLMAEKMLKRCNLRCNTCVYYCACKTFIPGIYPMKSDIDIITNQVYKYKNSLVSKTPIEIKHRGGCK